VVLSALVVGALVVGIVTLQALVSQTSFRMQDLQARTRALQQDYGERKLKVARLSAPDRIAAAARRAGLVLPDPSQVYSLHIRGPREADTGSDTSSAPGSSSLKAFLGAQP
jgi:cell division protein FtsL